MIVQMTLAASGISYPCHHLTVSRRSSPALTVDQTDEVKQNRRQQHYNAQTVRPTLSFIYKDHSVSLIIFTFINFISAVFVFSFSTY